MRTPALFDLDTPEMLRRRPRWTPLLEAPTPVGEVSGFAKVFGHSKLFVKREDLTASVYCGNKVRNLEFLLGDALASHAERVATVAPLGSNFTTALSAQAPKVGLPVEIFHFIPQLSPQIVQQAAFTESQGARMRLLTGSPYINAARAYLRARRSEKAYWIAPGGSSPVGVLGHINAALELASQVQRNEIPEPDYLIVGAGTCGTMAGLVSGLKLAGLGTQVIGVRCVDRLVCNSLQIKNLANQALAQMGLRLRVKTSDIDLRDLDRSLTYGKALVPAVELAQEIYAKSQILLDTTYTSKIAYYLKTFIQSQAVQSKNILYWHTFSPAALKSSAIAA